MKNYFYTIFLRSNDNKKFAYTLQAAGDSNLYNIIKTQERNAEKRGGAVVIISEPRTKQQSIEQAKRANVEAARNGEFWADFYDGIILAPESPFMSFAG